MAGVAPPTTAEEARRAVISVHAELQRRVDAAGHLCGMESEFNGWARYLAVATRNELISAIVNMVEDAIFATVPEEER